MDFNERLELILSSLVQERENRLVARLVKNAGFKYPMASIESLDYDSRQVKKSTIINLAAMGFVASATNVIIAGRRWRGRHSWRARLESRPAGENTGCSTSECQT